MTNSIIILQNKGRPQRPHVLLVLFCLIIFLGGCDSEKIIHVKEAFHLPWSRVKDMHNHNNADPTDDLEDQIGTTSAIALANTDNPGGLNRKNLFAADLSSTDARLDRLERAVQDMRNDFDMVQPSIKRLMALEGDLETILVELQKISSEPPSPVMRPAPVPAIAAIPEPAVPLSVPETPPTAQTTASAPKTFVKKSPPPVGEKPAVFDLRVGEHPGKTRIVLDINASANYTTDIDNNENILILELPNTEWKAAQNKTFPRSAFISSYKVEPSENGQLVIFQLRNDASIIYNKELKGFSGTSRRIVIDLGKEGST